MNIRHTTAAIAFIMAVLSTEFSGVWARNMMDAQRDSVCTSRKLAIIGQHGEPTASSDSVRHLIDMFYYDQFRHFQDPEAPYFLFSFSCSSFSSFCFFFASFCCFCISFFKFF